MSDEKRTHIEKFYDADPQKEWSRLDKHRIELAVSMRVIQTHLPLRAQKIADIGGGPGRYSVELAKLGHHVTLLDLSQGNLRFADLKATEAKVQLAGLVHGNALDLSQFADESFDHLLLMGPLYHLLTPEDRNLCLAEALRVTRRGGFIFASFITRYAAIRDSAGENPEWAWEEREAVESYLKDGVIRIPEGRDFTDHYAAHPAEVAPFMEKMGCKTHAVIGVQSLVALNEELVNELQGEQFERWVDLNYRYGHDPVLHGTAVHMLYVGSR
jgi:S-adenosylmethionine-dependent methyltransferase